MDRLERLVLLKLIESMEDLTLKLMYKDLTKLKRDEYRQGFIFMIEDEMKSRSKF